MYLDTLHWIEEDMKREESKPTDPLPPEILDKLFKEEIMRRIPDFDPDSDPLSTLLTL